MVRLVKGKNDIPLEFLSSCAPCKTVEVEQGESKKKEEDSFV